MLVLVLIDVAGVDHAGAWSMPYRYAMALLDAALERNEAMRSGSDTTRAAMSEYTAQGPIVTDEGAVLPPGFSALSRMMREVKP
jgi:hypothetical protein